MKVLFVYRTELKEGDKVMCREKEALNQRAGPVLKQCTEKGNESKSRQSQRQKWGRLEFGVWFDVVRKSRVVMLAGR